MELTLIQTLNPLTLTLNTNQYFKMYLMVYVSPSFSTFSGLIRSTASNISQVILMIPLTIILQDTKVWSLVPRSYLLGQGYSEHIFTANQLVLSQ